MKKLKKLDLENLSLRKDELKSIIGGDYGSSGYQTEEPTRKIEDTWTGGIRPADDSVLYVDTYTDYDV